MAQYGYGNPQPQAGGGLPPQILALLLHQLVASQGALTGANIPLAAPENGAFGQMDMQRPVGAPWEGQFNPAAAEALGAFRQSDLPPPLAARGQGHGTFVPLPNPQLGAPRRAVRREPPIFGRRAAQAGTPRLRPRGQVRGQLLQHLRKQVPMIQRQVRGY